MPPIVPDVTAQNVAGDEPAAPSGSDTGADANASADTPDLSVIQQLDAQWARGDWDSVIDLLMAESGKPDAVLTEETIKEKLYAANINAGHAALRLGNKEGAMDYFFAALEIAPERGEGDTGLSLVQRSYMDEARQLLERLQQQQAQAAQPAPPAEEQTTDSQE